MTAKFLKQIELVKSSCIELNLILPEELLIETAEELGPSIFNSDSKLVNSSDNVELELIKNNFLKSKFNLSDDICDKLIDEAVRILGPLKNKKYRILFYALLKDMVMNLPATSAPVASQSIFQKIKSYFFK